MTWLPAFRRWALAYFGRDRWIDRSVDRDWVKAYKTGFRAGWRAAREDADAVRLATIEACAQAAESQAPDVDDTGNGDEYRRGQKRGAICAAMMVRRLDAEDVRVRTERSEKR